MSSYESNRRRSSAAVNYAPPPGYKSSAPQGGNPNPNYDPTAQQVEPIAYGPTQPVIVGQQDPQQHPGMRRPSSYRPPPGAPLVTQHPGLQQSQSYGPAAPDTHGSPSTGTSPTYSNAVNLVGSRQHGYGTSPQQGTPAVAPARPLPHQAQAYETNPIGPSSRATSMSVPPPYTSRPGSQSYGAQPPTAPMNIPVSANPNQPPPMRRSDNQYEPSPVEFEEVQYNAVAERQRRRYSRGGHRDETVPEESEEFPAFPTSDDGRNDQHYTRGDTVARYKQPERRPSQYNDEGHDRRDRRRDEESVESYEGGYDRQHGHGRRPSNYDDRDRPRNVRRSSKYDEDDDDSSDDEDYERSRRRDRDRRDSYKKHKKKRSISAKDDRRPTIADSTEWAYMKAKEFFSSKRS